MSASAKGVREDHAAAGASLACRAVADVGPSHPQRAMVLVPEEVVSHVGHEVFLVREPPRLTPRRGRTSVWVTARDIERLVTSTTGNPPLGFTPSDWRDHAPWMTPATLS
jgi:hypothetical protein